MLTVRARTQRTTVTGVVVAGYGLSAFVFSAIARAIFPGDTSGFLLTLAVGTASPVVLGWFLVRVCPYPDHAPRVSVEDGGQGASDDASETAQLIRKDGHTQPADITGLALMRTVDFWVMFWIMSFCECFWRQITAPLPNDPSVRHRTDV